MNKAALATALQAAGVRPAYAPYDPRKDRKTHATAGPKKTEKKGLSVTALKAMAKERKIKGYTTMDRAGLLEALKLRNNAAGGQVDRHQHQHSAPSSSGASNNKAPCSKCKADNSVVMKILERMPDIVSDAAHEAQEGGAEYVGTKYACKEVIKPLVKEFGLTEPKFCNKYSDGRFGNYDSDDESDTEDD